MKLTRCKHCGGEYSNAGIRGHLRFKHDITDPTSADYEIIGEKPRDNQDLISPIGSYPKRTTEILGPDVQKIYQQREDPLDFMEAQLMKQMRIKNLQQMMKDLNAPQSNPIQQKDTLSEVVTIMDLVDKIQDRAIERTETGSEAVEGSMTSEEKMIMELAKAYLQKQAPQQNLEVPIPQAEGGNDMDKSFFGEEFVKKQIKIGRLSFDQIKEFLKQKDINISDEMIQAYIDDVKAEKTN